MSTHKLWLNVFSVLFFICAYDPAVATSKKNATRRFTYMLSPNEYFDLSLSQRKTYGKLVNARLSELVYENWKSKNKKRSAMLPLELSLNEANAQVYCGGGLYCPLTYGLRSDGEKHCVNPKFGHSLDQACMYEQSVQKRRESNPEPDFQKVAKTSMDNLVELEKMVSECSDSTNTRIQAICMSVRNSLKSAKQIVCAQAEAAGSAVCSGFNISIRGTAAGNCNGEQRGISNSDGSITLYSVPKDQNVLEPEQVTPLLTCTLPGVQMKNSTDLLNAVSAAIARGNCSKNLSAESSHLEDAQLEK